MSRGNSGRYHMPVKKDIHVFTWLPGMGPNGSGGCAGCGWNGWEGNTEACCGNICWPGWKTWLCFVKSIVRYVFFGLERVVLSRDAIKEVKYKRAGMYTPIKLTLEHPTVGKVTIIYYINEVWLFWDLQLIIFKSEMLPKVAWSLLVIMKQLKTSWLLTLVSYIPWKAVPLESVVQKVVWTLLAAAWEADLPHSIPFAVVMFLMWVVPASLVPLSCFVVLVQSTGVVI